MKTRAILLAIAVVAAAIATSCVKEEFELQDKPELEITGQVFEAVPEAPMSKSYLNGLTPEWIEGDQIFVSGSDKDAICTFVEGNKFQTEENVNVDGPFYAIYPAGGGNTVNRETGVFTATVPAIQKIAKGHNVAQGALVAVAASESTSLSFKNAVGLVKLNITRDDIMAVKIEALGEDEYVSGQFTMTLDGEEPAVTLVEETGVNSVTLNTVQNYGMFEPGEYYATVLPCNLSGIRVTFTRKTFTYDENGDVASTGSETVSVTKTATSQIERNAGINLGAFFTYEISTAEELLAWNKASAKWTVWDNVTLTDDINCAGVITSDNWTPNEFKGVFDGNGKTINNFVIEKAGPAAFFSKLDGATVKDVTFGQGCSFTAKAEWTGVASKIYAGSLAADAAGTTELTNVVNKGAVKTSATVTGGSTGNYVGGICAYYRATGSVTACENYGEVSFPATAAGHVWCGGLFGYVEKNAAIVNSTNRGHVLFNGTNSGNKSLYIGGITAEAVTASFNGCVNLGSLEINATAAHGGHAFMGGIVGVNGTGVLGTIANCVNGSSTDSSLGSVTNNTNTSGVLRVGGFTGYVVTNPTNITGFKNYGTISNNAEIGNWAGLGGVVGYVGSLSAVNTVSGCENYGTVVNTVVKGRMNVGGIIGFVQNAKTNVTECNNSGEVKNTGTSPSGVGVMVAGIVGRIEAAENGENTISKCKNSGTVSYAAKNENDANYLSGAAGILGCHSGTYKNSSYLNATVTINDCENNAIVKKTANGNNNLHLGGIVAVLYGKEKSATHVANIINCTNNKNAQVSNESTSAGNWYNYTGGIVGFHFVAGKIESCKNYAAIISKAGCANWDGVRVGGIGGNVNADYVTDCNNYGNVSDESISPAGLVGGIVGYTRGLGMTMTNCDNEGTVSGLFNNTTAKTLLAVGGLVGCNSSAINMVNCDNKGNVVQKNTVTGTLEIVGGIIAYASAKATVSNCSTNATITSARSTYEKVGAAFGRLYPSDCSVSSTKVYGTFNGKVLNADNYKTYCYGTSSEYKNTDGILFGTAN